MNDAFIIVGAGHAAAGLAPELRRQGWQGRILVIGAEASLPYHRPPLSKAYLAGEKSLEEILIRPPEVYEQAGVEFRLETRVAAVHPGERTVRLDNGEVLSYDRLALAVGARVRKVSLPGADLDGVFYLRDLADVERIRPRIEAGAAAVIVGGGYIGLETAAVLNRKGMKVAVLEMMERVLQRVTAPPVSEFYARAHAQEGVDIRCGTAVSEFAGNGRVEKVRCADGSEFAADLVIIGVGILPETALAEAAGLQTDDGIVVDEQARSSDPRIFAAGDCACHHSAIYGRRVRLESVQNAADQARVIAAAACGKPARYDAVPWFWSEQYDLRLQIAGLSQGYDEFVIRRAANAERSFAVFYLEQGRIIAVDAVNSSQEYMAARKLIPSRRVMDKARLADAAVPAREL